MTDQRPNPFVWVEIPVTDMSRAKAFYEAVLEEPLKEDNTGPDPMLMLPYRDGAGGTSGHLYPGKPAPKGEGSTAHLAVSGELSNAMGRVKEAGGEVVSDVITIPAGSFFYAIDPDGNSLGLFKV